MAANKFATMLHRNTNKITLILIYAVLEWTLIILLLFNSLFSYLIIKFADYFGLKPPCLWCSRVDHIFEPDKSKNMHRDLLCEVHATEISKLGYCSNHKKMAQSQHMCEDCLSSIPDFPEFPKDIALFPLMKQIGLIQSDEDKEVDNGQMSLKCSCCGMNFENQRVSSPCALIKPSWDDLDYAQKINFITYPEEDDHIEDGDNSDHCRSDWATDGCECENSCENRSENQILPDAHKDEDIDVVLEDEKEPMKEDNSITTTKEEDPSVQVCNREYVPFEVHPLQHLEFFVDCSGHTLVPVDLIGSANEEDHSRDTIREEEDHEYIDHQDAYSDFDLYLQAEVNSIVENRRNGAEAERVLSVHEKEEQPKFQMFVTLDIEEDENSVVFHAKDFSAVGGELPEKVDNKDEDVQSMAVENSEKTEADVPPESEEVCQISVHETEPEVSIGTDIPDLDTTDELQTQEAHSSHECLHDDPSTSSVYFHAEDDQGFKHDQGEMAELRTLSLEVREPVFNSSLVSEFNEVEEDRVPYTPTSTPTSIDSLHHLHKKLLLFEKKDLGAEESLDGSIISEFEGGDGVTTVERLKSALQSERKALHALYSELEEERSASAVAANQTMAMINRLQEEKAAMQMEALQYQRMMEEQSEYDQEALQLLNELMVKREKEKQELEKELEIYRKKLVDYGSREKMRTLRRSKDGSARSGFSSPSCSNAGDSDGLSIDLNQETKEDESFCIHHEHGNHDTPLDAVLNLEESLADFEEERLSILEQLKVLEEKLVIMSDVEEPHFEDVSPMEQYHEENRNHFDENLDFARETNGYTNGFLKEMNGHHHHHEKRIIVPERKRLLPLFDAISEENGVGEANGHENGDSNGYHNSTGTKFGSENKKLAVEEELDHLYERLQALEADREFLRHCIGSVKKGDRGADLLQEILQHLRDLRNMDLRVKNLSDYTLG